MQTAKLIACEFSGVIRDAFIDAGYKAVSVDLLPGEGKYTDHHIQGDIREVIEGGMIDMKMIGLLIAHPPCTHLAVSGARWFKDKVKEQQEALEFVNYLMELPIDKICIENPVSVISTKIRKPTQIIQPWQFGHGETKATCLWLKNLPKLIPTNIVEGREARIHKLPPSEDRWKLRSITYTGIAQAIVKQWGVL